jgi:hypothetical protein
MRISPTPRDPESWAQVQGDLAAGILLLWDFLGCSRVALILVEDRLRLQCFVRG